MDDTDNGNIGQHPVNPEKAPEKARKPKGYWTEARCKESASRFETRNAWKAEEGAAYYAARSWGCWADCCGHMREVLKPSGYWTLARCQASALQFETRTAWAAGEGAAYQAATRLGFLDACCGHMREVLKPRGYWTKARCQESARQFETRYAWAKGAGSAYAVACNWGWLDDCCGHMREVLKPVGYWTAARCKESALQFETRVEWRVGAASAYGAAQLRGELDDCCGHMRPGDGARSDGDAVYIWRAVGHVEWGLRLYKMGATSARLGDQRINQVARRCGMTPVIKALTPVRGCAFELEAKLLQLGKHPHWLEGDGRTEFRALTTAELDLALDMIAQAAA